MTKHTAFWDDLAHELRDPESRREFLAVAHRLTNSPADAQTAEENRAAHARWIARGPNRDPSHAGYAEEWNAEQCGGCHWYRALEGTLGADWGVRSSLTSELDGTIRFEHDGCEEFAPAKPGAAPFA
jgi:hypothetical protein